MSRAELELLDHLIATTKQRLRAAASDGAGVARTALDPSPLIRAHPEASVVSSFVLACFAGRRLRQRRPRVAAATAGATRTASRRTPLRSMQVLMRLARMTARQWLIDRVLDVWNDRREDTERPRSPRVA